LASLFIAASAAAEPSLEWTLTSMPPSKVLCGIRRVGSTPKWKESREVSRLRWPRSWWEGPGAYDFFVSLDFGDFGDLGDSDAGSKADTGWFRLNLEGEDRVVGDVFVWEDRHAAEPSVEVHHRRGRAQGYWAVAAPSASRWGVFHLPDVRSPDADWTRVRKVEFQAATSAGWEESSRGSHCDLDEFLESTSSGVVLTERDAYCSASPLPPGEYRFVLNVLRQQEGEDCSGRPFVQYFDEAIFPFTVTGREDRAPSGAQPTASAFSAQSLTMVDARGWRSEGRLVGTPDGGRACLCKGVPVGREGALLEESYACSVRLRAPDAGSGLYLWARDCDTWFDEERKGTMQDPQP
jgi:hypothetical protein